MARTNRYEVRYLGGISPILFTSLSDAHRWAASMNITKYRIVMVAKRNK
jgi:hypothetical protein